MAEDSSNADLKVQKNMHTLAVTDNSVKTVQRALTVDEQTVAN